MKIAQKRSKKIPIIVATVLILAVAIGAFFYVRSQYQDNSKSNDSSSSDIDSNPEQQKSATETKEQSVSNSSKNSVDSTNPTDDDSLAVSLSANGQNGDIYQLRYLIQQNLVNGTCTLTLTKDGNTITKSAPIQALSSSSTCQGFNIDMSELSSGTWQASLTVQSDSKTGKTSNTINI